MKSDKVNYIELIVIDLKGLREINVMLLFE